MTGLNEIKVLFQKNFPIIPENLLEDFQVETQGENARRVKILGVSFIVISLALLCLTKAIVGHDSFYRQIYILVNAGLLVFASLMFVWGLFVSNGRWDISSRFSRIYDVFVAVVIVLWASWMTFTEPFAVFSDWILLCSVFLVYSVLLFSLSELVILSSLVIIGQFLLPLIFHSFSNVETDPDGRDFQAIALAILATAAVLSRVLLYSRIRVYLNWENINRMNLTLKREVSMHLKTTDELEHIRQDLDSKVHRQTKHLREANQRLSEEIAERRYADKVRGILYRISTFVNRHQKLDDVFEFIHSQLEAIMDVKNFFIGQFDEEDYSIHSSFEVAESDLETEDISSRSLGSYLIRQRKAILLDKKTQNALAKSGDVEFSGTPLAHSWLGVPLMVENRIVGILVVKSFSGNLSYDHTDLELLEYVSEHIALAIARRLSEVKLISAKEKAEESDQLKSAFLSNLSHEIRTPMNAIVGFSELIGSPDLEDAEREYFSNQVVDNSNYLLKLISNIIELSKIQSEQIFSPGEEISVVDNLNALLPGLNDLKRTLNKNNLDIELEVDELVEDKKFSIDPERFKQIMYCLVENGLKFTKQGGVQIHVQLFDRNYLQVSVSDTGIGMDESETKEIFELFRQGSKASEDLYRGMGLGLTLAKLLIDTMGGRIWVETELGSGTCFLFTLPYVKTSTNTIELPKHTISDNPTQDMHSSQVSAG